MSGGGGGGGEASPGSAWVNDGFEAIRAPQVAMVSMRLVIMEAPFSHRPYVTIITDNNWLVLESVRRAICTNYGPERAGVGPGYAPRAWLPPYHTLP